MPDDPDSIRCFDNPEDAYVALVNALDLAAEALPDCAYPTPDGQRCDDTRCPACPALRTIEQHVTELKDEDVAEGQRRAVNDGRALDVVYWVAPVLSSDCDHDKD